MFSIENNFDNTTITILDGGGEHEDVAVIFFDDIVYIRQYIEDTDMASIVTLTPKMFSELMAAWNTREGSFLIKDC